MAAAFHSDTIFARGSLGKSGYIKAQFRFAVRLHGAGFYASLYPRIRPLVAVFALNAVFAARRYLFVGIVPEITDYLILVVVAPELLGQVITL